MNYPLYPSLYQINTRVLVGELSRDLGRPATLDDLPDSLLDDVARLGFDWVWPLGVWQTGPAARGVSLANAEWRREYLEQLPDCTDDDISGSPFAIRRYEVNAAFGGDEALARLRARLAERGLRLLVDFVPNHMAPDHPWVFERPELFVHGSEDDLAREPQNYTRLETNAGPRVFAHGRDPYFPGWPDTVQLNYRHPQLREAMCGELERVARMADGVRCDMAMLVLPDVIRRTWGERSTPDDGSDPVDAPFWPEAVARARAVNPGFVFMAEVYWDLEWELQQQGFDYTYDKHYYDRLHARDAAGARGHLRADPDFQRRSARFLENHDEPRAASAFATELREAAAVLTFLVPGLRFFHEGQLEGRCKRVSMHLGRRADESADEASREFYDRLLAVLRRDEVRNGEWTLADVRPAWDGNATSEQFVAFAWEGDGRRLLVAVNYGPSQGQCYVRLPFADLGRYTLRDLMSPASYDREGDELYLDMPAWGYHVFEVVGRNP
jgi:glycosidase